MIPDWECCICLKPADYSQGRKKYCSEHWNYGNPVKPTLHNVLDIRATCDTISIGGCKDANDKGTVGKG